MRALASTSSVFALKNFLNSYYLRPLTSYEFVLLMTNNVLNRNLSFFVEFPLKYNTMNKYRIQTCVLLLTQYYWNAEESSFDNKYVPATIILDSLDTIGSISSH